jgi:hypothetical protein
MNKIMILKGGSPAIHKLGDIGRDVDDKIRIYEETDVHYIGNFEEGFGFIDVKFRKEDCRPLTEGERNELNGSWYGINDNPLYRIYVDNEGNVINGKCIMKNGTITNITDLEGNQKHFGWHKFNVDFPEDIQIGKGVLMIINYSDPKYGQLTTSPVTDVEIKDNNYIIHTNNSIYYIEVN